MHNQSIEKEWNVFYGLINQFQIESIFPKKRNNDSLIYMINYFIQKKHEKMVVIVFHLKIQKISIIPFFVLKMKKMWILVFSFLLFYFIETYDMEFFYDQPIINMKKE
ncbi:hypothetical protein [Blattabacterium cuenoti]|uniref:hypothetical protein n=1 Tax=Blattabacterium cuenoti TaxID=1653831 RepID=UPI00163B8A51|nr:hypothetical protein [Blattabacterium cuenoti]